MGTFVIRLGLMYSFFLFSIDSWFNDVSIGIIFLRVRDIISTYMRKTPNIFHIIYSVSFSFIFIPPAFSKQDFSSSTSSFDEQLLS